MGIEHAAFHRRLQRKMRSKDARLAELYARTCTVCGKPADPSTGTCGTCGRQVFQVERDPVPAGVMRPVDPEKAQRLKEFYARLERQQKEREKAATPTPPRTVERLPGESLPGEEPEKRDWSRALAAVGLRRLYRF
jgi:hypothetical protein